MNFLRGLFKRIINAPLTVQVKRCMENDPWREYDWEICRICKQKHNGTTNGVCAVCLDDSGWLDEGIAKHCEQASECYFKYPALRASHLRKVRDYERWKETANDLRKKRASSLDKEGQCTEEVNYASRR